MALYHKFNMSKRSFRYVSDVIAKRRRIGRISDAYREYLDAYAKMLLRRRKRDDFIHPIEDLQGSDHYRTPLQVGLDAYYGESTSVGSKKVRGNHVESNDAVERYLPMSYFEFNLESPIEQRAHIHDLDMYDGVEDPKSKDALRRKRLADEAFREHTGHSSPYVYHKLTGHHDTPKRLRGGVDLTGDMDMEADADPLMDVEHGLEWDEELMNEDFDDPMNLAQNHNIPNFGSTGGMKQFSDTKVLQTTTARLGTSDRLRSPFETLMGRFRACRRLATAWHHRGSSETNKREVFTYVFRHCITIPPSDAVLSPQSSTISKQAPDEQTITLKSAEKSVNGPVGNVWYSPYCLKELETVSWNINNFKLQPIATGLYLDSSEGELPGRVLKDEVTGNEDDNLTEGKSIRVLPTDHGPTFFNNQRYSSHRQPGDENAQDSVVRSTSLAATGQRGKHDDIGRYNVQLGRGDLSFTFVNTGDTTMIVDAVVHRAKEGEIFHPFNFSTLSSVSAQFNPGDIQSEITEPYEVNYLAYHTSNQDRKVSDYVRERTDVVVNPEVKFLPTSYRLSKIPSSITPSTENGGVLTNEEQLTTINTTENGELVSTVVKEALAPPTFIDVQRKRIVIGPNQRKTLHLIMPAEHYDPTSSYYNGVFNDHGFAVTFGVTGKTAKVVVPAGLDVGVAAQARSSQFVGRTAAATSFHIFGSESQVIYPVHLSEKDDYASQINRLADPQLLSGQKYTRDGLKLLQEAVYAGPSGRQIDGRYAFLLTDGAPTAELAQEAKKQRTPNQHIVVSIVSIDNFINYYNVDANGQVATTVQSNQKIKMMWAYGAWYTDKSVSTAFNTDVLKSYIAAQLQKDVNVSNVYVPNYNGSGELTRYARLVKGTDFNFTSL